MNHFPTIVFRHSMSLRVPLSLYEWICTKSDAAGLPPATYTIRRLEELARNDVQKGEVQDGPEAV